MMFKDVNGIRWGRLALLFTVGWTLLGVLLLPLKLVLPSSAYNSLWIIDGWLSLPIYLLGLTCAVAWLVTGRQARQRS